MKCWDYMGHPVKSQRLDTGNRDMGMCHITHVNSQDSSVGRGRMSYLYRLQRTSRFFLISKAENKKKLAN